MGAVNSPNFTTRHGVGPSHILAMATERELSTRRSTSKMRGGNGGGVVTWDYYDGSSEGRVRTGRRPPSEHVSAGGVAANREGGVGLLGRGFAKLPRLPTGGRLQRRRSGEEGRGGRRAWERGGKNGGGAGGLGCLAEVQGRDDGRHWTARIAIRVDRASPLHPCAPVLRCMWDGGSDRGRR